jgi:hypothetical protein
MEILYMKFQIRSKLYVIHSPFMCEKNLCCEEHKSMN